VNTLSFIDVETTGLTAATNRVIELAIIRVTNGEVIERYSQLINPERPIPSFIQEHTGITPKMVKNAPTFADIFPKVQSLLEGGVFVAHNASFDYSFIQEEFRRQGATYVATTLCTVRLSRRLFPGYRRHGLDSIIQRFGIECPARHRALDDAEVVWQFYKMITQNVSPDLLLAY
jgi:DNA polymerase-3 subunit epsilon